MEHHLVVRIAAKLMIPLIMLFALYVQFHGDFGPGGGFQAGVIFGSAVFLYALTFGLQTTRQVVPESLVHTLSAVGVLLYAGVGVVSLMAGGNFLEYGVLDHHDPVHGQHLGILLVELGVGITVTSVMISLFYSFVGFLEK